MMSGFSKRNFTCSAEKEIGQVLNSGGRNTPNTHLPLIASYHSILNFNQENGRKG